MRIEKFTYGQAVEQVRKSLPQFDRVAALALVVKAVDPAAKGEGRHQSLIKFLDWGNFSREGAFLHTC